MELLSNLIKQYPFIPMIITIISLSFAIWQARKNTNLRRYLKTEAIELYSDVSILVGSTQSCLSALQSNNTNLGIQCAGKVEGMAQAIFYRSVKNIHYHYHFTRKDIDKWIAHNKIHSFHKDEFLKYAEK